MEHDARQPAADPQWQAQNLSYLMQAIAVVRAILNVAAAEAENAPAPDIPALHQSLAAIATSMPTPPSLDQVCYHFDLTWFERMILLCCVGQAIDPQFPGLLAKAQGITEGRYPTFQLALQCFENPHWNAVTERRPLRYWQLVHWAAQPEPSRAALQIDEAVLHYLMGEPYHDPVVAAVIQPSRSLTGQSPLQPSHQTLLEQIVALFQATPEIAPDIASPEIAPTPALCIQLCGTLREIQWAIAQQVSAKLQRPSYVLPSDAIPSDRADLQNLLRRWQRWLKIQPCLLCVEITALATPTGSPAPLVAAFLSEINVPILVITDGRLQFSQLTMMTFEVSGLQYGEQLQLWQAAWPNRSAAFEVELARLASQFRLSAPLIQTASAALQADERVPPTVWGDRLWDFCRAQARPQLESLAQPIRVKATWQDLILPEREMSLLHQITIHVRQQAQVYQD